MSVKMDFAVLSLFLVLLFSPSLSAFEYEAIRFEDKLKINEKELVVNGAGMRRASFLNVDVYAAVLYVTKKTKDPVELVNTDGPKQLIMHFVRDVDADSIRDAWKESFEKIIDESKDKSDEAKVLAEFKGKPDFKEKLMKFVERLNQHMTDVRDGDRYVFTISGDQLIFKSKEKEMVEKGGALFQKAMLLVWLGSNPPNEGLKDGILGK